MVSFIYRFNNDNNRNMAVGAKNKYNRNIDTNIGYNANTILQYMHHHPPYHHHQLKGINQCYSPKANFNFQKEKKLGFKNFLGS